MEIEVSGARPVPERVSRGGTRGPLSIVLALAAGAAFGFAVAADRPVFSTATGTLAAPPTPVGTDVVGLSPEQRSEMVSRVGTYNKSEADTVESTQVRLMMGLRNNLTRLDDDRRYPAGDYRLQVICLGDGQVWGLFRIGDDETYVDMDCHADHVLVSQLLLTAHAGGRRTVTVVTDSPLGVAIGLQVLHRLAQ